MTIFCNIMRDAQTTNLDGILAAFDLQKHFTIKMINHEAYHLYLSNSVHTYGKILSTIKQDNISQLNHSVSKPHRLVEVLINLNASDRPT